MKAEGIFRRFLDTCKGSELVSVLEAGVREKLKSLENSSEGYSERNVAELHEVHETLLRLRGL